MEKNPYEKAANIEGQIITHLKAMGYDVGNTYAILTTEKKLGCLNYLRTIQSMIGLLRNDIEKRESK